MIRVSALVATGLTTATLLACSSGTVETTPTDAALAPDAVTPVPDAGFEPDAAAPPGPVTVTLIGAGAPVEGEPVAFNDEDGTLLALMTTGPDGTVQRMVPPNVMVTVVVPAEGAQSAHLATWTGVQPGDDLLLSYGSAPTPDTVVTVQLPPEPNGFRYATIEAGCARASRVRESAILMVFPDECVAAGKTVNILATAYGRRWSRLGYAIAADLDLSGPTPPRVDLGQWRTDHDMVRVELSGAPYGAERATITLTARRGEYSYGIGSETMSMPSGVRTPTAAAELEVPAGFSQVILTDVTLEMPYGSPDGRAFSGLRTQSEGDLVPVDLTGLLGTPQDLEVNTSTLAPSPSMRWIVDGDPAGEDAIVVRLEWATGLGNGLWTFSVPPMLDRPLVAPVLPGDFGDLRLQGLPDATQLSVYLVDVADLEGYDDFRARFAPGMPADERIDRTAFTVAAFR